MPEQCSAEVAASCAAPLIMDHNAALASACRAAQDHVTSLMTASENGHVEAVKLLMDRRADIHATGGEVICARHAYAGGQARRYQRGRRGDMRSLKARRAAARGKQFCRRGCGRRTDVLWCAVFENGWRSGLTENSVTKKLLRKPVQ